jgi:hypothetical protein
VSDASVFTYVDLQDAVLDKRFPSSRRASVTQWLAVAYQDVWDAGNWSFKQVSREAWYTTADGTSSGLASATPTMPATLGRVTRIFDDLGDELDEYDEDSFEGRFSALDVQGTTGRPYAFTVIDRQIHLAPKPDAAYLFNVSYRRRMAHRNVGGVAVAGFMTQSDDSPLWSDHQWILVPRAQAIGLKMLNDPTWPPLQDEYDRLLTSMKRDYEQRAFPRQWPSY